MCQRKLVSISYNEKVTILLLPKFFAHDVSFEILRANLCLRLRKSVQK